MGRRLTKEEVVERIKQVHGDKYDFTEFLKDEFEYKNKQEKIPLICHEKYPNGTEHGLFEKDLAHLEGRKQGCPKCSSRKKYDIEIFKELATKKYKGKYIYDDTDYIRENSNDIFVECRIHGKFRTTVGRHLNGQGCPYCTKSTVDWNKKIEKFREIHGDKYDYSIAKFLSSQSDIDIICPKHGVFQLTPNEHENGHGCPKCAKENKKSNPNKKTFEEVVEDIKKVHGENIIIPHQEYINNKTHIIAICPKHGQFLARVDHLKDGEGCPFCNSSKLEKEIKDLLVSNNIEHIYQCSSKILKWLGLQKFDFYLPKHNIAIECQGEQHFVSKEHFGGEDGFQKRLHLDKQKKELCNEHGIRLLYYSNLNINYPYQVFVDKEKLLNEILNTKMIDSKKLIEELKARGLMSSVSGDLYNTFSKPTTFYVGTDPTGDSLHVGHLLAFTTAKLLQSYGHRPIVLVGGFTAKIGDPSFRDTSRPLITDEEVLHNSECIKAQVSKLIDFDSNAENKAIMLNNDEWMGKMSLPDYMTKVAKLTTVNYMMAKESVKKRLNREGEGISLCEFLYMTAQGYDFLHLYKEYDCHVEIGGQDQYGNCTIGTEFIRKSLGKTDVCVLTWPLVTRADGTKFGKSSNGKNIWLDPKKTSPFEFYQFWLNQSDVDAEAFIKKFTLIPLDEIDKMIAKHRENPSSRYLQKELAKYMTCLVHSEEEYNKAVEASNILFGKGTTEQLATIDENALLAAMDGVYKVEVQKENFVSGVSVVDVITMHDKVTSKSEARKLIKANGFAINKTKISNEKGVINESNLINGKYLLLQKGKKDYSLVIAS